MCIRDREIQAEAHEPNRPAAATRRHLDLSAGVRDEDERRGGAAAVGHRRIGELGTGAWTRPSSAVGAGTCVRPSGATDAGAWAKMMSGSDPCCRGEGLKEATGAVGGVADDGRAALRGSSGEGDTYARRPNPNEAVLIDLRSGGLGQANGWAEQPSNSQPSGCFPTC